MIRKVFLGLLAVAALVSIPTTAGASNVSWTRVAQCLPDLREDPIELACSGTATEVEAGRYVILVTEGTAHLKQGVASCDDSAAALVPGTQVAVEESKGGDWCCMSSEGAKVQLLRCR